MIFDGLIKKIAFICIVCFFNIEGAIAPRSVWPRGLEQNVSRCPGIFVPARIPGQPKSLSHGVIYDNNMERYVIYEPDGQSKKIRKAALSNVFYSAGACAATAACWIISSRLEKSSKCGGAAGLGYDFLGTLFAKSIILLGACGVGYGISFLQNCWGLLKQLRVPRIIPPDEMRLEGVAKEALKQNMGLSSNNLYFKKIEDHEYFSEKSGLDCAPLYYSSPSLDEDLEFKKLFQTMINSSKKIIHTLNSISDAESLTRWADGINLAPKLQHYFSQPQFKPLIKILPCYKFDSAWWSPNSIESYSSSELYFTIPTSYGLLRIPEAVRTALNVALTSARIENNTFAWIPMSQESEGAASANEQPSVIPSQQDPRAEFNELLQMAGIAPCNATSSAQEILKRYREAILKLHPDKMSPELVANLENRGINTNEPFRRIKDLKDLLIPLAT